jgi:hypothetical protein
MTLLMLCAMLTVSGAALVAFATTLRSAPVYATPAVHTAVAHAFYAAVDDVLAGGDRAALDAVLAPDFAWRNAPPGLTPDANGLAAALLSLRDVAPATRFTPSQIDAAGDWIAIGIAVSGLDTCSFLGIPCPPTHAASRSFALLRVADRRITEYWGEPSGPALTTLLRVAVPVAQDTRRSVTFERWSYAPGSVETRTTDHAFVVLLVDAGELTVDLMSADWLGHATLITGGGVPTGEERSVTPGSTVRIRPGDALIVTDGSRFVVRNEGAAPAVALVVATAVLSRSGGEAGPAPPAPAGVDHAVLAGGFTAGLPEGSATVSIGRAVLAPGTGFPPHLVGVEELGEVESGALAVTAAVGGVWVKSGPGASNERAGTAPISSGSGVLAEAGAVVGYLAASDTPLTIVLVTISGGAEQTTPVAAR